MTIDADFQMTRNHRSFSNRCTILFGGAVATISSCLLFLLSDELNRTAFHQEHGHIANGKKFGISVGAPAYVAQGVLNARGLILARRSDGGNCYGRMYPKQYNLIVYFDGTWRHGSVCIASINNQIKEISWFYSFLSP
jgi:hypothetical protein